MTTFADGLQSFVTGLGTDRDKGASVQYTRQPRLTDEQLTNIYDTPFARRIVDQVAEDATRKWREWQADADQISALERTEKRIQLKQGVKRAKILARLFGKAHLYISIAGHEPSEPLNPATVRRDALQFVQPLSKREIVDGTIDDDPFSPFFGSPEYYDITSPSRGMVRVHPSRLVTLYGAERPKDMIFGKEGQSILEPILSALKHHDSTVANVAGLVFEAKIDILSIPGLQRMLSNPDDETALLKRFATMSQAKGNQGMVLLNSSEEANTPSEEWQQKNMSFATLPDIILKMQEHLSGAARIPRVLLFGASAGGLGSTGDLELSNYYDSVSSIQENEIEPAMSVLDECVIRSALGARPADVWYSWRSLWQTSDKEKAEIGDKIASKWQKLIASGGLPAEATTAAIVNELTEAGVGGGIEQAYEDWLASGGEFDREEPDDMVAPVEEEIDNDQ